MPSNFAIRVRGLTKSYPNTNHPLRQIFRLLLGLPIPVDQGFQALKPLDFDVQRGETLGIIGRNGAGKSTLLQMICGTLEPTQGSVQVNGRLAALLELGAGFNMDFTGRENIYLSSAVYGLSKQQIHAQLENIIAFAEIGEHIDHPVKTYSSGMFVRLAFAIIAHVDADILVIDEALAVGDVYFTQKCMRFLQSFTEQGTLLFVSHDTGSVNRMCQRALWLEKGQLKMLDTSKTVVDAYLGSFYADSLTKAASPPDTDCEMLHSSTRNNFNSQFGTGAAKILACQLLDENGTPILIQEKKQTLHLQVDCIATKAAIDQPIVGFYIKDRLGQPICGHNTITLLPSWDTLPQNTVNRIRFSFDLPLLASGDYTITVSLAAGTQTEHIQHHWVHDILNFKAQADPHLLGQFSLDEIHCHQQSLEYPT